MNAEQIRERIAELGDWFHNLDLRGVRTAPAHFLGDYPAVKWNRFAAALPHDLSGKTVLDVGCNAGFYSMEMKRRGAARVVGIDTEPMYLRQASFAAEVNELDIEFRQLSVYDVADLGETFDFVIFMGVLYHLRHPLLALDLLREHVVGDLLLFQSMQRGTRMVREFDVDYDIKQRRVFKEVCYPKLHFVEHRYAGDETNWWIPNRACAEAMLRSAGFEIVAHPELEVYLCRRAPLPDEQPRAVYPAKRAGGR